MIRALFAAIVAAAFGASLAAAAEIKVISAYGMSAVIADTKAAFEAASGHRLTLAVVETGELRRRLFGGEPFDVALLGREVADELVKQGKIMPSTEVGLTRVNFGLAVSALVTRPDVSTPDALKRTLLAAKTVIITDPGRGGISGVHFVEVLNKLGIADQMKDKLVAQPAGEVHAQRVVLGQADLAVQTEHQIRCVRGATFLDYPAAFQKSVLFVGGVAAASANVEAAKSYLAFLTGPDATAAFRQHCLEQRVG